MKYLTFALIFFGNQALLHAQNNVYTTKIDSLLLSKKIKANAPCIAVLVAQNNKIVYEWQAGLVNIKENKAANDKTVFNIGSVSKQFTVYRRA